MVSAQLVLIPFSHAINTEILKDVPPSINVYENKAAELCVFTTSQCEEGIVLWNDTPYYHGRPASRTAVAGGVVVFGYALKPGEATIAENGSRVQFVLSPGVNGSVTSEVAGILIAGTSLFTLLVYLYCKTLCRTACIPTKHFCDFK